MYNQVTDETKVQSYQSQLEKWEMQQEEKKHAFTITQDDLPSVGSSSTVTPSRGGMVSNKLIRAQTVLSPCFHNILRLCQSWSHSVARRLSLVPSPLTRDYGGSTRLYLLLEFLGKLVHIKSGRKCKPTCISVHCGIHVIYFWCFSDLSIKSKARPRAAKTSKDEVGGW